MSICGGPGTLTIEKLVGRYTQIGADRVNAFRLNSFPTTGLYAFGQFQVCADFVYFIFDELSYNFSKFT